MPCFYVMAAKYPFQLQHVSYISQHAMESTVALCLWHLPPRRPWISGFYNKTQIPPRIHAFCPYSEQRAGLGSNRALKSPPDNPIAPMPECQQIDDRKIIPKLAVLPRQP